MVVVVTVCRGDGEESDVLLGVMVAFTEVLHRESHTSQTHTSPNDFYKPS